MILNKSIELGLVNTLRIDRDSDHGLYLESEDKEDVLLPNAYVTDDMKLDELIDVFIYTDSLDRLVATTLRPKAMRDEFLFCEVVDILKYGAFVDWGLPKDLFVPRNKQKIPFEVGDTRIIRIIEDKDTDRLIGVEKTKAFLQEVPKGFKRNHEVELLVFARTPLGYKVIVDNTYEGLLYKNEIFTDISIGDRLQGYIKQTTYENKLDITLQPLGIDNVNKLNTKKVLEILDLLNGECTINYKSDSKEIKEEFNMSKKAYKRALNTLIEQKKITLLGNGIIKKIEDK